MRSRLRPATRTPRAATRHSLPTCMATSSQRRRWACSISRRTAWRSTPARPHQSRCRHHASYTMASSVASMPWRCHTGLGRSTSSRTRPRMRAGSTHTHAIIVSTGRHTHTHTHTHVMGALVVFVCVCFSLAPREPTPGAELGFLFGCHKHQPRRHTAALLLPLGLALGLYARTLSGQRWRYVIWLA